MAPGQKRLQAVVHGMVQGVGFRWHTRRVARMLSLRGYVRNQPDRTVLVVAEGPERVLREFLSYLQVGPSAAAVERVDAQWSSVRGGFHSFEVRF